MKGPLSTSGVAAPASNRFAKKRQLFLAVFVLLGSMFSSMTMFVPSASAGVAGTIVMDGAALLDDYEDWTIIDFMHYGARVDVLYGPFNGMYEIYYYGTHGYVFADKIEVDGQGGQSSAPASSSSSASSDSSESASVNWWSEPSWVIVNTDVLNVRADAGTWSAVWDSYGGGTWLKVVGSEVNGFYPIEYGGGVAWVSGDYISWDGSQTWSSAGSAAGTGSSTNVSTVTSDVANWSDIPGERWIDIDRTTGLVSLYIGDTVMATYWASLSRDQSADGFYTTALGTWYVTRMYEPLAYTRYAKAYITHWVEFDPYRDNGFHSYMKDANGNILPNGAGYTGGCVGLNPEGAQAVYDFAFIGMRVEVHL